MANLWDAPASTGNLWDKPTKRVATGGFNATYQDTDETLYDIDLVNDVNFQKASEVIYNMNNSVDAPRLDSAEDYARYGIEHMGWFNWNLPKMTFDANRISGATDEQKRAFLYMMESYDDLGASWKGTGRFFSGVILDPTTWVGLTTFGIGLAGKEAGKQATKLGIKELLKSSTRAGVVASVESGVYTAVDDINRQVVETAVSGEDIDFGRVAKSTAFGATVGFGLGTGISALVKKVKGVRSKTTKETAESVDEGKLADDLPEVDEAVPPITDEATPAQKIRKDLDGVIQAIKRTVPTGKAASLRPDGTQDLDELVESVEPIKQMLEDSAAKNPQELADYLQMQRLTDGEGQYLEVATSQTVSALKVKVYNLRLQQKQLSGEEALAVQKQIDEVEEVIAPLDVLDSAMSTITGQRLRARQASYNTGELRGTTIQSLMAEGNLSRIEAERQWDAIFEEKLKTQEVRDLTAKFDKQIDEARKSGDTEKFLKLKHEKQVKLDEIAEETIKKEGTVKGNIYRAINKPIKVMNEVMISFVFSPATLIVNLVPSFAKTIYKPFLNNVMMDGLSKTSRKKIVSEYSAMASMIAPAFKMARAAWRYEKSILTGDSARFLEEYNTIPKKYGGHFLRFFPRALLATDAFFENIHYRGYAVGNATGKAMEEGIAKGFKGKKLDDYVQKQVDKAVTKAYAPEENAIDILMQDGISRGLKGKELENFVNKELAKNKDTFLKATDQDGRDYVQDVLFKRDFSGNSTVSALARGYEGFVNKHPAMRLMGQLFFRTPVRVFEEGIRMTPGLNLISPGFWKDLNGVNGPMRQARAQGEALMSYAIAGYAFTQYAQGNLTGQMGDNFKQTRQGENAGGMEPYSIRFDDGSIFNYRNFDPFSTPIKIIVNALERAEALAYREEQGERVDKSELDKVQALVSVAVGSIAQSLRDANLASGVDAAADFWEDIQDPESSDQLIKFLGRKVQAFLPNTFYKFQMLDNPVLGDPVTMEQFIRQRVNPDDPLVPRQYTALGRPRTDANPEAKLIYFSTASVEDRKRGKSDKEIEVEQFLYKIAQAGDTHFTAPYTFPKYMGKVDLRKQVTKDGTESYYDRWMRYTLESNLVNDLHRLTKMDLPMGTKSTAGVAETKAKEIINKRREQAFVKLLREEGVLFDSYKKVKTQQGQRKQGKRDVQNLPFPIN